MEKQVNRLQEELNNWTTQLSRFVDELEDEEEFREDFYFLAETGLFFTKVAALLPRILDGSDERYVSWLNIRPDRGGQTCPFHLEPGSPKFRNTPSPSTLFKSGRSRPHLRHFNGGR